VPQLCVVQRSRLLVHYEVQVAQHLYGGLGHESLPFHLESPASSLDVDLLNLSTLLRFVMLLTLFFLLNDDLIEYLVPLLIALLTARWSYLVILLQLLILSPILFIFFLLCSVNVEG
jgi:hypothetical protein